MSNNCIDNYCYWLNKCGYWLKNVVIGLIIASIIVVIGLISVVID